MGAPSPVMGPAFLSAQLELGQRTHLRREDDFPGDKSVSGMSPCQAQSCKDEPLVGSPAVGHRASVLLRAVEGSYLKKAKLGALGAQGTHEEYVLVSSAQAPSTFSAICSPLLRQ